MSAEGRVPERQIEQRLWVKRREFIAMCGASVASSALLTASMAMADDPTFGFDDFLEVANDAVKTLLSDRSDAGQSRYLRRMGAAAAGLSDAPAPAEWRDSGQSDGPGTFIGFNPGGVGFVVLQWRMDPGARILPHAHTYGNVATVGLEGAVRVRNYEVVGRRDFTSDADFIARRTVDQRLSAGDTNFVSLERNYIHGFDAGTEGGRGIDITTRLYPKPDYPVPYLELGEPLSTGDVARDFRARWQRR